MTKDQAAYLELLTPNHSVSDAWITPEQPRHIIQVHQDGNRSVVFRLNGNAIRGLIVRGLVTPNEKGEYRK